jgi:hypothetical protein
MTAPTSLYEIVKCIWFLKSNKGSAEIDEVKMDPVTTWNHTLQPDPTLDFKQDGFVVLHLCKIVDT